MKRIIYLITSIFIAVALTTALAYAATYSSANYSLVNARIAITGGSASSSNYALDFVEAGNPFSGQAQSTNYSFSVITAATIYDNPPQITEIVVNSQANFHRDWPVTIRVEATDPDGDAMEYRYLINGQEAQNWTVDNEITWKHAGGNIGSNDVEVEVRSQGLTSTSVPEQVHTFRKPIAAE